MYPQPHLNLGMTPREVTVISGRHKSFLASTSYRLSSVKTPEHFPDVASGMMVALTPSGSQDRRLNLEEVAGVRLKKGRGGVYF